MGDLSLSSGGSFLPPNPCLVASNPILILAGYLEVGEQTQIKPVYHDHISPKKLTEKSPGTSEILKAQSGNHRSKQCHKARSRPQEILSIVVSARQSHVAIENGLI